MATTPATTVPQHHPAPVKVMAHVFSYIFHPLFLATYVSAFLLFIDPYEFAGVPTLKRIFKLIAVFFNTAFIPGFAVFLMWRICPLFFQ